LKRGFLTERNEGNEGKMEFLCSLRFLDVQKTRPSSPVKPLKVKAGWQNELKSGKTS